MRSKNQLPWRNEPMFVSSNLQFWSVPIFFQILMLGYHHRTFLRKIIKESVETACNHQPVSIFEKNIKNKNKKNLEGGKVATLFPKGRIWFFGRVDCEPCTMIGLFFEVGIHALNLVKTCLNSKQLTNFLGACSPKNLGSFIFYHCGLHCKDVSFLHPHCICMGIVFNNL